MTYTYANKMGEQKVTCAIRKNKNEHDFLKKINELTKKQIKSPKSLK